MDAETRLIVKVRIMQNSNARQGLVSSMAVVDGTPQTVFEDNSYIGEAPAMQLDKCDPKVLVALGVAGRSAA